MEKFKIGRKLWHRTQIDSDDYNKHLVYSVVVVGYTETGYIVYSNTDASKTQFEIPFTDQQNYDLLEFGFNEQIKEHFFSVIFHVPNNHPYYYISRDMFEEADNPMVAYCWTDERMERLAELISKKFHNEHEPKHYSLDMAGDIVEEFHRVAEECAKSMYMRHYSDLSDELGNRVKNWHERMKDDMTIAFICSEYHERH